VKKNQDLSLSLSFFYSSGGSSLAFFFFISFYSIFLLGNLTPALPEGTFISIYSVRTNRGTSEKSLFLFSLLSLLSLLNLRGTWNFKEVQAQASWSWSGMEKVRELSKGEKIRKREKILVLWK